MKSLRWSYLKVNNTYIEINMSKSNPYTQLYKVIHLQAINTYLNGRQVKLSRIKQNRCEKYGTTHDISIRY